MIQVQCLLVLAAAALLVLARNAEAEQRVQLLAKVQSSVGAADWLEGGSCGGASATTGCRREAVAARVVALGQPFENDACGVVDRSVGDGNTMEDVTNGATLGVLHACESGGEVLPQVGGWVSAACMQFCVFAAYPFGRFFVCVLCFEKGSIRASASVCRVRRGQILVGG